MRFRSGTGGIGVVALAFLFPLTLAGCKDEKASQQAGRSTAPPTVRVVSWGGLLQEDLVGKWILPAGEAAGVRVEAQTWNGDMGALATRIQRSVNTWDLVHVELQDAFRADRKELFASFPQRSLNSLESAYRKQSVVQEGVSVPNYEWGYVLAYRKDVLGATPPQALSWSALWDTTRYRGRRGLRDWPIGSIEIALLSLNRDPRIVLYSSKLTRQEVDEQITDALDRLDRIKAQTTWWETGDQVQRGLSSGDMAFTAGYTGRTGSAFQEVCPGATSITSPCNVAVNSSTAIVGADWWIIPKGAENSVHANRLLEEMYGAPAAQKGATEFSAARGYHVPINGLHVKDDLVRAFVEMGSSRNPEALQIDSQFWSSNFTWIMERWRLWRSRR